MYPNDGTDQGIVFCMPHSARTAHRPSADIWAVISQLEESHRLRTDSFCFWLFNITIVRGILEAGVEVTLAELIEGARHLSPQY